jgi:hypothetical protein
VSGNKALYHFALAGVVWFVLNAIICAVTVVFIGFAALSLLIALFCGAAALMASPKYALRRWCQSCGHTWTV